MLKDISRQIKWNELDRIISTKCGMSHLTYRSFEKQVIDNQTFQWNICENWEAYSDFDLVKMLDNLKSLDGSSVLISEVSYLNGFGPYILEISNLDIFSKVYYRELGECCLTVI